MIQKFYAILIIDYLHNERTTLDEQVFSNREDAKAEVKTLAYEYIRKNVSKNLNDRLEFREDDGIIYGGPSGKCVFAEIQFKIQEITFDYNNEPELKNDSALVRFAKRELNVLLQEAQPSENNYYSYDSVDLQRYANRDILDLIRVFSKQGHSGYSSTYILNKFNRLARWKPISAITGNDDEWVQIEDGIEQNKRLHSVFRQNKDNSTAIDVDDIVISDNGGVTWFTSNLCKNFRDGPITFPYLPPESPKEIYIKWIDPEKGTYEVINNNPHEQEKLRKEFYEKEKV